MIELEEALRALPESVDVTPSPDLVSSVRRKHVRRTLRRRAVIGGVAVIALVVSTAPTLIARANRSGSDAASSSPEAVTKESLDAALTRLAKGPGADEPRPTGKYAYTHSRTRYLADRVQGAVEDAGPPPPTTGKPAEPRARISYLSGADRHIWLDKTSGGHLRSTALPPVFLKPGDEEIYKQTGMTEHRMDGALGNGDASPGIPNLSFDSSALPTKPEAMRKYLQDVPSGVEDVNERTFTAGGDLLRETILPLKVRVAVLRALLLIPDVSVVADVADFEGRTGIAIGRVERGTTLTQLIVGDNASLLGERQVTVADGEFGPAGTVIGHTAVLESRFVDQIDAASTQR